jgi:hypothetical protein
MVSLCTFVATVVYIVFVILFGKVSLSLLPFGFIIFNLLPAVAIYFIINMNLKYAQGLNKI